MTKFMDYSDASCFRDQMTFNYIISNDMYLSFQYATCILYLGGVTGRRLRGYEVDQLIDHLGPKQLQTREQQFKEVKNLLEKLNAEYEDTLKQKEKIEREVAEMNEQKQKDVFDKLQKELEEQEKELQT